MDKKKSALMCPCKREGRCQKECRMYIDYPEEHNCALVSVRTKGSLTLREIAKRLDITYARVYQIEQKALKKLKKMKNKFDFKKM